MFENFIYGEVVSNPLTQRKATIEIGRWITIVYGEVFAHYIGMIIP